MRALSPVAVSRGCSLVAVLGLLIVVASLVAEHSSKRVGSSGRSMRSVAAALAF